MSRMDVDDPSPPDSRTDAVLRLAHDIHHDSPCKAVLHITGGAMHCFPWLVGIPGASNTLLEATVPYTREAMIDTLGSEPEQFVSRDTAIALGRAAYRRAVTLARTGEPTVGVGVTCALASEPVKRGEHRVFVAAAAGEVVHVFSLALDKGSRDRSQEDRMASRLAVWALAQACGIDPPTSLDSFVGVTSSDQLTTQCHVDDDAIERLVAGEIRCVEFSGGLVLPDAPRPRHVYLAGSFNPLHEGHTRLLDTAAAITGLEGCYEISVVNADKGVLEVEDIRARVAQFVDKGLAVMLTRAPLFNEKAALLRDSTFVVGYDTAERLLMPKYYGGTESAMVAACCAIRDMGGSFIVGGRVDSDGTFRGAADLHSVAGLEGLFDRGIPESDFRKDVSSSAIRARRAE